MLSSWMCTNPEGEPGKYFAMLINCSRTFEWDLGTRTSHVVSVNPNSEITAVHVLNPITIVEILISTLLLIFRGYHTVHVVENLIVQMHRELYPCFFFNGLYHC